MNWREIEHTCICGCTKINSIVKRSFVDDLQYTNNLCKNGGFVFFPSSCSFGLLRIGKAEDLMGEIL